MGLLDDAIREHLELKRRNGADPGEVAREQQEALDPIFPGASAGSDGDAEPSVEPVAGDVGEVAPGGDAAPQASPVADAAGDGVEDAQATSEPSSTGQETVELDMQSVLHAGADGPGPASPTGPAFAGSEGAAATHEPEAESLDWEMPGERSDKQDEPVADGPRRWTSEEWDRADPPGRPEERSDLQRELPGQERLSFE
jgi:hypothetical protein